MRIALLLVFVLCLPGCRHDDRIKRAASVHNAKTITAKKEFEAAPSPDAKIRVAEEYFRNATEFSQVFEDYVFSRKPSESVTKKP